MYYKDQTGYKINLKKTPKRIISLVPSQTELLCDLGLEKEVVGITKFCIHPKSWFNSKERVGGTKKINFDKVDILQPDLVIGNKEENQKEQIEQLREKYPVWLSDVNDFTTAKDMIKIVGEMTDKQTTAKALIAALNAKSVKFPKTNSSVLYFIWHEPKMVIGQDTFIHSMLTMAGFNNAIELNRYPTLSDSEIQELNPDVVMLSSEPFPFKEKHIAHYQELLPDAKIELVDGELFSWYGSRLLKSFDYFSLLNARY